MGYDVTNFTDYIGRENEVLTGSLFAGGDTGKFARFMSGVKGKTTIPAVRGTVSLKKGNCATAGDSKTDAGQYSIEVTLWKYKEAFCQDDLQSKFPATMLAPGSSNGDAPKAWEESLVDVKVSALREALEVAYWQGDTTSADESLSLFDGFIKKIDAATGDEAAIDGNTSKATAITEANIIQIIDDIVKAAPTKVKNNSDFAVVVGDDLFEMYTLALRNENLYHYAADNDGEMIRIPASNKVLRRVYGLSDTNRIFAGRGSSFVVGCDVEDEASVIDVWFDKTDDAVYFQTKAKSGVTPTFTEEIVEFTLAV